MKEPTKSIKVITMLILDIMAPNIRSLQLELTRPIQDIATLKILSASLKESIKICETSRPEIQDFCNNSTNLIQIMSYTSALGELDTTVKQAKSLIAKAKISIDKNDNTIR
jgi:hypothetical protein